MKKNIEKSIELIKKTYFSQSYQNYLINYKKKTSLKKSTVFSFLGGVVITISSIILSHLIINDLIEVSGLLICFNLALLAVGCGLSIYTISKLLDKMSNEKNMLNESDFIINELKDKTLNVDQIKSFESTISLIKNNLKNSEFEELLFKAEKKSGKEIGNAYFYYFLFLNYDDMIKEIKEEKKQKEMAAQKSKVLMNEEMEVINL